MGSKQSVPRSLNPLMRQFKPIEKHNMLQGGDPVFIGYDIEGNTYWEYYVNGKRRRFSEPANYEKLITFAFVVSITVLVPKYLTVSLQQDSLMMQDKKLVVTENRPTSEWYGWLM